MAYTALTVTYSNTTPTNPPGATAETLTSEFIPGYPEYYSSTDFNAAFYTSRKTQCAELIGPISSN